MISRLMIAAVAAAFAVGITMAPTASTAEAAKKELSPQQQKMKDCSVKWGDEKKAKGVKGKKAHDAFMSTCLKG